MNNCITYYLQKDYCAHTGGISLSVNLQWQSDGHHQGGANSVCKLQLSLYELKQAARNWNEHLYKFFTGMGCVRIEADGAVYVYS